MDKVQQVIAYAKEKLSAEKTGHDFLHAERVAKLAEKIMMQDQLSVNRELVYCSAYLHDVIDDKVALDVTAAVAELTGFLLAIGFSEADVQEILQITQKLSFANELTGKQQLSLAGQIVQDADRLEALGALGILRTAYYGGAHGHPLHDEALAPKKIHSKADYRQGTTVINHFYEKLFLLPEKMNTTSGKIEAKRREKIMRSFLEEFYQEWRV